MGRYLPNIIPLLHDVKTSETELRARETEYAQVLARLDDLQVTDATRAIFQRFIDGELTIRQLNDAIDEYLRPEDRH